MVGPIRQKVLLAVAAVTPLGFAFKQWQGPAGGWFRNHGAGVLYEVFWILIFFGIFPTHRAARRVPVLVLLGTISLEILQLWHPPFLQAIRSVALGRVLIGTTFAWWDIPHYVLGCALGGALIQWILRSSERGLSVGPRKGT